MLINQAIAQCTALTGQVVETAVLVRWLSEIDGRLAFEFYRTEAWTPYDPTDDLSCELLVPFPWDGFYVHHLAAQTYFANGEYDRYENERVMGEKTLTDFRSFMQRTQSKLCCVGFPTEKEGGTGITVIPGDECHSPWFWLSAYALAVKHGFKGSEDEWLDSVQGPNRISEATVTPLDGVLAGNGSTVTTKPVDSAPDASHSGNLISSKAVADALSKEIIAVSFGTVSALPQTVQDARITADHVVLQAEFGTPSACTGDLSYTTAAGSVTLSGTLSASTTMKLILGKAT